MAFILAGAGVLRADWTYGYADDFAGDRVATDSYRHSTFWAQHATPLAEPYLYPIEVDRNMGLAFAGYRDALAELGYRFPPDASADPRAIKGVVALDVSFPAAAGISPTTPGQLFYSTSPDGMGWSSPEPLSEGHHEIPVTSPQGAAYILFSGDRAVIDNLSVSLFSSPVTIRVPGNFATIQAAIDAAGDGDVIEVAPGRYSGTGNRDIDFRGKAITVRSASGPQDTIIDCGRPAAVIFGSHRGFYFHQAEGADSVLSGFTIQGGRVFGSEVPPDPLRWNPRASHPLGGGIYCEFSSPTISDCIIRDCGAELGGGIGVVGAAPMIVDCVIEQCTVGELGAAQSDGRGGAIGMIGATGATITNCTIRNNSGSYNSHGAGIYLWQSRSVVAGCTISANSARGGLQGGGVYCGGTTTDAVLRNCVISQNEADAGAGIFAEWTLDASLPAAVQSQRALVHVVNCTVAQNTLSSSVTPQPGGGIHSSGADTFVVNSIVWHNEGTSVVLAGSASKDPVAYSDIEGGHAGTGNLNADPLFASLGDPDYHLQSQHGRYDPQADRWVNDSQHSPCIDAGNPSASVGEEPAPNGRRINMGAYGGTAEASHGTEHSIYHVDISRNYPGAFTRIQDAIDIARNGDTIFVWPGVYQERLTFMRKAITVQSAADAAVLTAPDYAVSFYYAESSRSVLANFVIRGCGEAGIFCEGASPSLKNLTIVGNNFGIVAYSGADPNITNCILWRNTDGDLWGCKARYSDIEHNTPDIRAGNIRVDPLFADPDNGDYHLKSRAGRYVPREDTWVTDTVTSPCIDAGNPDEDPRGERMPNGDRIDMGAHGGTPFASLSVR